MALDPLGSFWAMMSIFELFQGEMQHTLESLSIPQILKVATTHKNTVSRKQSRKNVVPEHPRIGQILI